MYIKVSQYNAPPEFKNIYELAIGNHQTIEQVYNLFSIIKTQKHGNELYNLAIRFDVIDNPDGNSIILLSKHNNPIYSIELIRFFRIDESKIELFQKLKSGWILFNYAKVLEVGSALLHDRSDLVHCKVVDMIEEYLLTDVSAYVRTFVVSTLYEPIEPDYYPLLRLPINRFQIVIKNIEKNGKSFSSNILMNRYSQVINFDTKNQLTNQILVEGGWVEIWKDQAVLFLKDNIVSASNGQLFSTMRQVDNPHWIIESERYRLNRVYQ